MITLFAVSAIAAVVASQEDQTTMDNDCAYVLEGTCYENMDDFLNAVLQYINFEIEKITDNTLLTNLISTKDEKVYLELQKRGMDYHECLREGRHWSPYGFC